MSRNRQKKQMKRKIQRAEKKRDEEKKKALFEFQKARVCGFTRLDGLWVKEYARILDASQDLFEAEDGGFEEEVIIERSNILRKCLKQGRKQMLKYFAEKDEAGEILEIEED